MSRSRKNVKLQLAERLRDSEKTATSMSLPLAVAHRLDLLAEAAQDLAATRAEIIGMLIAEADLDSDQLEDAILRYRKLKVADVLAPAETEAPENVISIKPRGPGRPAKSGGK